MTLTGPLSDESGQVAVPVADAVQIPKKFGMTVNSAVPSMFSAGIDAVAIINPPDDASNVSGFSFDWVPSDNDHSKIISSLKREGKRSNPLI